MYFRILRLALAVLLLALGSSQSFAQQGNPTVGERRVALVIGNAAYKEGRLTNPVNDARAIATRLRTLGFDVLLRENLKLREIGAVYREFRSKITPGGVALVFYAGHGIQIKGQNYFPVVDSDIDSEEDVPLQSLNLGTLLDTMEEAKAGVSLVLLDACRDNPYARRFRSATRGLAKVEAASGTLIHYATKPGSVASDGRGKNGTYTEALLSQIGEPNLPVEQMLKRVTNRVVAETKGKQEPWVEGSLRGEFYFIFKGPTSVQVQSFPPVAPAENVRESAAMGDPKEKAFELALASNDWEELKRLAKKYPNSEMSIEAEKAAERIRELYPDDWLPVGLVGEGDAKIKYLFQPSSLRRVRERAWIRIRGQTAAPSATVRSENITVIDCKKNTVGISEIAEFQENGKQKKREMWGDPIVIELTTAIPNGSVNDTVAKTICPPQNPGRILSRKDVESDNWKLLATVPNSGGSLLVHRDSIVAKGKDVRAIIKMENSSTTTDGWATYLHVVQQLTVNCVTAQFAAMDADFIDERGHLAAKLLPINRMNWISPVPNSPFSVMVKTLCLSAE